MLDPHGREACWCQEPGFQKGLSSSASKDAKRKLGGTRATKCECRAMESRDGYGSRVHPGRLRAQYEGEEICTLQRDTSHSVIVSGSSQGSENL